ncbi:hypothetical protein [Rhizobium sp. BK176]|uniref:hypothetical protein n=1 Tax=Rhizobium sp. BK176 TaxID=2587071 RepID=UPI00216976C8|nr:hypothetical protein [Rhizobium sp. BK176]MCS4088580.1 hypothetical protein [Rhizobium sp. BK176]
MKHIGRKVYNNWGPNLTVGLGLITSEWSGFKLAQQNRADMRVCYLSDFGGEIMQVGDGFAPAANTFGKSVNQHLEYDEFWRQTVPQLPVGFCGMRMITTWSDTTMLVIDKIAGDPAERFDIHSEAYMSAMAYDVFEVDGELMERKAGRPVAQLFGFDANRIITKGPWFSEEQDRDYVASKQAVGIKVPGF